MKTIAQENASPYMLGYKAYQNNLGVTDNPFTKPEQDLDGRSDYWRWWEGWRAADRQDGN